ncbi:MAG TPA: rhomboid family intramembrane serine protease [Solirubrobacteraceae bacterium]|nr:rhomboid family intramembrane serine protease [Solirubrobacteraceae bacterium]
MIPLKDNIPTDRFPYVTVALIIANVIVYLLAVSHGGSIISGPDSHEVVKYGAIPAALTHCLGKHEVIAGSQLLCAPTGGMPTWQTVFTSMFMHASFLHIAGNMLFLWIFGNNVEDAMGPVKFVLFYILGGIAALALQVVIDPNSTVPTLGASGAIAAVLGGYILLYPRARVLTLVFIILFFTVIELPALIVLAVWFIVQAVFGAVNLTDPTGGGGGVAYFAHVGGFLFGLTTVKLLATRRKPVPPRYPVY